MRPKHKKRFSDADVAKWVSENTDVTMDRGYVFALRTGAKFNPTQDRIQALADFFGVPPAYFFDGDRSTRIVKQVELAAALRNPRTRNLTLELLNSSTADVELIAEAVRVPELLEVVKVALSIDRSQLHLAAKLLRSLAEDGKSTDSAE
ncbi:hypothetical protein ACFORH_39170 [Amycolatopsis roodepoortensis]|uniref:Transcriptional regulator with XRE-family HTH domain n=1 Tax=Amycolatopsis roodepoortensis TaxID=700274 RepID=A0ABR9LIQ3_9PSEU|nr:hypothetical protein [Amycolatopsis roodepoortensis]MBE1580538.1 transcriptional regulator with XRE-family HTH domain [Amycolatopsis roodepoortensis]